MKCRVKTKVKRNKVKILCGLSIVSLELELNAFASNNKVVNVTLSMHPTMFLACVVYEVQV